MAIAKEEFKARIPTPENYSWIRKVKPSDVQVTVHRDKFL
jgi:hypothetical protein